MNVQKKLSLFFLRNYLKLLAVVNNRKAGSLLFRIFCTPISTPPVQMSKLFAQHQKITCTVSGRKIYGYHCNAGATRRALLLHGFSSSIEKFDHYVEPLISLGYEVWGFDAPAHGMSEGKTINALEYSDMVQKLFEQYGHFDAVIAHSFGGLAIALALEKMQLPQPVRVVMIAPATETTSAIDQALKMLGVAGNKRLRNALENKIIEISENPSSWFSVRRAMQNIDHPVLWIHDETDNITPIHDVVKAQEDRLPHVEFFITSGLGHRRIYKDEKVMQKITGFLK